MKQKHATSVNRFNTLGIGLIFLLCLPCPGMASALEEFKAAAKNIHTLRADFIQEKHLKILSSPLLSRGVFYYQAPNHLRWEYRSPVKSLLLMKSGHVNRYIWAEDDFKKNRGLGLEGMQGVFGEINSWLKGEFGNDSFFRVGFEEIGHITLVPKAASFTRLIQKIVLALSDRPGVIRSVTVYEGKDSFTRIVFKHIKVNTPLDASSFNVHD